MSAQQQKQDKVKESQKTNTSRATKQPEVVQNITTSSALDTNHDQFEALILKAKQFNELQDQMV